MKKQNSLSYEIYKSQFDADSEAEAGGSYVKIMGGTYSATVAIPTSIMHRLFRLGQAYGMRQLRYFETDTKLMVGTIEAPEFVSDLKRLLTLVNDEVLQEYVDQLITAFEAPSGASQKHAVVSTGSYFEKRP